MGDRIVRLALAEPVLDNYSRYILAWKLNANIVVTEIQGMPEMGLARAGLDRVCARHHRRFLWENGPCHVSGGQRRFFENRLKEHTRTPPSDPMTPDKIESSHRSMRDLSPLETFA
jgi:transposase InsO family protein